MTITFSIILVLVVGAFTLAGVSLGAYVTLRGFKAGAKMADNIKHEVPAFADDDTEDQDVQAYTDGSYEEN